MTGARSLTLRPFSLAIGAIGAIEALIACCSSPTENGAQDREFSLTVFDGIEVPGVYAEVLEASAKAEILSGYFHLYGDGSCANHIYFRMTIDGEASVSDHDTTCTWAQLGDSLTLSWDHMYPSAGALVGTRLTLTFRAEVMCLMAPCPSAWTAEYQELPGG